MSYLAKNVCVYYFSFDIRPIDLRQLPAEAMRLLAGHKKEGDGFFLPRGSVHPPDELRRKIFPWLETAMEEVIQCERENSGGEYEYAGRQCLECFVWYLHF